MKSKYKQAIVSGGCGFIGSHLCEELLLQGLDVISIDDYSAGTPMNVVHLHSYDNFIEVACDICNKRNVRPFFEGTDIVFNLAACKKNICLNNPHRDLEVNAGGTLNLLELSMESGVKKFIHASTGSVYGEPTVFPQDETHPLNPRSYYGVSKLAGEQYVRTFHDLYDLDTTVLRYFHVYGHRQAEDDYKGGVVAIFIKNALHNKDLMIHGDGTQIRSFTYVKDVVKANIQSALLPTSGKVFNCASGLKITVNDLAELIINILSSDSDIIYDDWLVGDIKWFDVDNRLIKNALGINFTSFKTGLMDTINRRKMV